MKAREQNCVTCPGTMSEVKAPLYIWDGGWGVRGAAKCKQPSLTLEDEGRRVCV